MSITFNQYDYNVIIKAFEEDLNVFVIRTVLSDDCLLKAARAFIVFQIIENNAVIIKSAPKVEDLEGGKFDKEFTVVVISEKAKQFFLQEINAVSEIDNVEITPIVSNSAYEEVQNVDNEVEDDKASENSLDYILGIAKMEDRLITVLNVEKFLADFLE